MNGSILKEYIALMRLNKPIGIYLLLWPTLWALWIAGEGKPDLMITCIFISGVILMRSAGCIINDFADRDFDAHVARTRERPLATQKITSRSALILFAVLLVCAFLLVLMLNRLTIFLAFIGAGLAIFYPFMKRFTHLPQLGLGLAFAWGVPMAFAAQTNEISSSAWLVFLAGAIWPVMYDTLYAMADRSDDIKIGIKSTAILFGKSDKLIVGLLQLVFLCLLTVIGVLYKLQWYFFISIFIAGLFFVYQQWLIRDRDPKNCIKAFLNNHWVGLVIFLGIIV